jgi:CTP synthase (UTP-ammonia lyase)
MAVKIGLIGDYNGTVPAHQAIPIALRMAAEAAECAIDVQWLPTEDIIGITEISHFDGLWCVPASPYRSMEGALLAIRFAREGKRPFLGTCGGFQHAIIEYARNVRGWADAEHAETAPDAARPVVTLLECALVEATDTVRFRPASRIAQAYGCEEAVEPYRCRYGINPQFRRELLSGPLRIGAEDHAGDVRAVELDEHPFFVATLFQPERAALTGQLPPLVAEFVQACSARVGSTLTLSPGVHRII